MTETNNDKIVELLAKQWLNVEHVTGEDKDMVMKFATFVDKFIHDEFGKEEE